LLVKPVTEQGALSVELTLPQGVWFNFWNDKKYLSDKAFDKSITIAAPLSQTPVLVRAGAFIPMVDAVQSTKDYNTKQMTLHYYADASVPSSTSTMYNDDGEDPKSLVSGDYETLTFKASHQASHLDIAVEREGTFSGAPKARVLTLIVHQWQENLVDIKVGTEQIKLVNSLANLSLEQTAAWFDPKTQQLHIKFIWQDDTAISIK
jgi:oligosaccharide 4-alpha-D-glucosyltransferase